MVKNKSKLKSNSNSTTLWIIFIVLIIGIAVALILKQTSFQQSPQFSPEDLTASPSGSTQPQDSATESPSSTPSPTPAASCSIKIPKAECKGEFPVERASEVQAKLEAERNCLQSAFRCAKTQAVEPILTGLECLASAKEGEECEFTKKEPVNIECKLKAPCIRRQSGGINYYRCTYEYEYDEGPDNLAAKTSGYECKKKVA